MSTPFCTVLVPMQYKDSPDEVTLVTARAAMIVTCKSVAEL